MISLKCETVLESTMCISSLTLNRFYKFVFIAPYVENPVSQRYELVNGIENFISLDVSSADKPLPMCTKSPIKYFAWKSLRATYFDLKSINSSLTRSESSIIFKSTSKGFRSHTFAFEYVENNKYTRKLINK